MAEEAIVNFLKAYPMNRRYVQQARKRNLPEEKIISILREALKEKALLWETYWKEQKAEIFKRYAEETRGKILLLAEQGLEAYVKSLTSQSSSSSSSSLPG